MSVCGSPPHSMIRALCYSLIPRLSSPGYEKVYPGEGGLGTRLAQCCSKWLLTVKDYSRPYCAGLTKFWLPSKQSRSRIEPLMSWTKTMSLEGSQTTRTVSSRIIDIQFFLCTRHVVPVMEFHRTLSFKRKTFFVSEDEDQEELEIFCEEDMAA